MQKQVNKTKLFAIILALVAVGLIITGFFVPPMGSIDGSVLQGAGEIIGLVSIFFGWDSVDKGFGAKLKHKDTEATIGKLDNNE